MAVYGAHAGAVIYPVSDRVTEELTKHYKKRLQTVADSEYLRGSFGEITESSENSTENWSRMVHLQTAAAACTK